MRVVVGGLDVEEGVVAGPVVAVVLAEYLNLENPDGTWGCDLTLVLGVLASSFVVVEGSCVVVMGLVRDMLERSVSARTCSVSVSSKGVGVGDVGVTGLRVGVVLALVAAYFEG